MSRFSETDIRKQQKYEKRIQNYVDNTVNDLCQEIKFEICVKNITIIIIQLPQHFLAEADTKKHRYALAFADCQGNFEHCYDTIQFKFQKFKMNSICRSWSKPVSNMMARVYLCSFS